jgi:hypothetical protein
MVRGRDAIISRIQSKIPSPCGKERKEREKEKLEMTNGQLRRGLLRIEMMMAIDYSFTF